MKRPRQLAEQSESSDHSGKLVGNRMNYTRKGEREGDNIKVGRVGFRVRKDSSLLVRSLFLTFLHAVRWMFIMRLPRT